MSIEITLFGMTVTQTAFVNLAGLFGGFFPLVVDLLQRQNTDKIKRNQLCGLFFTVKLLVLPLCAFIITWFASSSGNVTTWLAALYLGATFPVFAQKAVGLKQPTINTKQGA